MGLLAAGTLAHRSTFAGLLREADDNVALCERRFAMAHEEGWSKLPIGMVMTHVGRTFLGTPYVAHALEVPGQEHLVVSLGGLDCVTFVESTLALSRCIVAGTMTYDAFCEQLTFIRYRGGVCSGYPSRLHYFSDWIHDNEAKHVVDDISRTLGGERYAKTIDFMSTHRSAYPRLAADSTYAAIQSTEEELASRTPWFLPKAKLGDPDNGIHDGDILGITTAVAGLDVAHTGMAIHEDGVLKYLHAPLSQGKVQVTSGSLFSYLSSHAKQTGVMVARPLEPV